MKSALTPLRKGASSATNDRRHALTPLRKGMVGLRVTARDSFGKWLGGVERVFRQGEAHRAELSVELTCE
jgi:hypothetical protein